MILLWTMLALAHPLAPSVLRLEPAGGETRVTWIEPAVQPTGERLAPVLPCEATDRPVARLVEGAVESRWTVGCDVVGAEVGVRGLESGRNAVVEWTVGSDRHTALLHAGRPAVTVAASRSAGLLAALESGARHLALGWDHLLFLGGLVLLLEPRRLVVPITAFTAGHALSLALAGLGWVPVASAPAELAIAGSLLWLAGELVSDREGWLARRPGLLCLGFGLVHGLGFAGAWTASGLGEAGLLVGLLGFNLGIELAQLGFVGALVAVMAAVGRPEARVRAALVWAGGAVAAMWAWERAAVLVGLG